jgi:hypothetical protein
MLVQAVIQTCPNGVHACPSHPRFQVGPGGTQACLEGLYVLWRIVLSRGDGHLFDSDDDDESF